MAYAYVYKASKGTGCPMPCHFRDASTAQVAVMRYFTLASLASDPLPLGQCVVLGPGICALGKRVSTTVYNIAGMHNPLAGTGLRTCYKKVQETSRE